MTQTECFVCNASLAQFDEAAANFHINRCLDGGGDPASSTADDVQSNTSGLNSTGIALIARSSEPECPICGVAVSDGTLEDHVEACLIASQEAIQPAGAVAGNGIAGSTGLDDDASGHCPCCQLDWSAIDLPAEERELHVTECLSQAPALAEEDDDADEDDTAQVSSHKVLGILNNNGFGKLKSAWKGQNAHAHVTPHLIPQLRAFLDRSTATRLAVLCTTNVSHIKTQFGDFGWGCGYKSACMVFSALRYVDQYRDYLLGSTGSSSAAEVSKEEPDSKKRKSSTNEEAELEVAPVPTIEQMQQITEEAWDAGFDPEGKRHFNGKLVGSRRWIGTSEVYTMFTWMGIRTTVVDFPKVPGNSGAHTVLAKWVFDYFKTDISDNGKDAFGVLMGSKGSSVRVCEDRLPLYLQHQGHSRTIVGVEQTKAGDLNLLVFDCGKKIAPKLAEAAMSSSNKRAKTGTSSSQNAADSMFPTKLLEPFRVNLKSLSKKDEYQILRVETTGGPLSRKEKLARREITSLRVT